MKKSRWILKILNKIFYSDIRKILFLLIVIGIIAFSFSGVYSSETIGIESKNLIIGKNHVRFNLIEPFYVRDLIRWNPEISVVSYVNKNKTIGYVNLFNGIGENFIIENGKDYELILNKNIELAMPSGTNYLNVEV